MKKSIAAFLCLVMVFAFIPFSTQVAATTRRCDMQATGSFIQSWLCNGWSDARWGQELSAMQDAGMTYLVLSDTASRDSGNWTTYYPSTVSELSGATYYGDVVDAALRNCELYNIKVFLGMGMYSEFWTYGGIGSTYTDFCNISAKIAEDLYNQYYNDYPDSFYGFYFVPEFNNNYLNMTPYASTFASGLNVIISKLNQLNNDLPLLMSPYYNKYYTAANVNDTETFWNSMFSQINFRSGDIFSPQDAVGAAWIEMCDLGTITSMYRRVVDNANKGVILWSNCEDFTQPHEDTLLGPPETENTTFITSTLDRYVDQLDVASQYADNIITFAWNHYYSPYYVNSVFNDTYLDFLGNGVLESQAPAVPTRLETALQADSSLTITWNEATDNIGIAAYRVFKNGDFLYRSDWYRNGSGVPTLNTYYNDADFSTSGQTVYQVEALDGAGNVSDRINITVNGSYPDSYVDLDSEETFKVICDTELIPAGTMPGVNDSTGYYSNISGNGTNYLINTVNNVGYQESRAIQYSVPSGASANEWVSFRILSPSYNNTSANGGTDLYYWVDTTGFGTTQFTHTLYFSENDTAGNETTHWTISSSGDFYIENGNGGFMKLNFNNSYITYPAGYKGFVRIPQSSFVPTWSTEDSNDAFGLDSFNFILLAFNSWYSNAGKSIKFDHFGFGGDITGGAEIPSEFYRYSNKTVTDFSLVPDGILPGVNDTTGYFSNLSGNGGNFLIRTTDGAGYKNSRGLEYGVPSNASANAWVSFQILSPSYNNSSASGGKELYFWIDTTNFVDSFSHLLYFSEYDASGDETTIWAPNSTGTFYIEDGYGGFTTRTLSSGYLNYPSGYKGFVKVPLSIFSPIWGTGDTNSLVGLDSINYILIAFNSWYADNDESIYFDNFGFNGLYTYALWELATKCGYGYTGHCPGYDSYKGGYHMKLFGYHLNIQ